MEYLANFWIVLVSVAIILSFVLSLFHGSLVTTWMLINTLQLVAHLPLITNTLPSNAHYFLLSLLGVVRMHIDQLGATLDDFDTVRKEFEIQSDPNNQFFSNLLDNGYHVSFLRNTLFLSSLIVGVAFVWFWMAILENTFCKRKGARRSTLSVTKEVFLNNFLVRLLYTAFFELVLCALVNVRVYAPGAPGGMSTYVLSIVIIFTALIALVAIASLYLWNGPYIKGSYEKGSLLYSLVWGARPLSSSAIEAAS